MFDLGEIESIVKTYDLSPRLEERITRIASRRIEELGITSYDDGYTYIANLIDKFQSYHRTRLLISLDSPVSIDGRLTLNEILRVEDSSLDYIPNEKNHQGNLSFDELLYAIKGQIADRNLETLSQLAGNIPSKVFLEGISLDEVLAKKDLIEQRLEELSNQYKRNGRIMMPRRPIISVSFSPFLKIKFGRRKYNGDPLGFYLKNKKHYEGLTRTGLFRVDSGLYHSLRIHNQLEKAVPQNYLKKLTEEEREATVRTFLKNNRDVKKTARELGYSYSTVYSRCKKPKRQFPSKRGRPPLAQDRIKAIIETYYTCHANAKLASRQLQYPIPTILKYWETEGLKSISRQRK